MQGCRMKCKAASIESDLFKGNLFQAATREEIMMMQEQTLNSRRVG